MKPLTIILSLLLIAYSSQNTFILTIVEWKMIQQQKQKQK